MKKTWMIGFRKPGCSRKMLLTTISVLTSFFLICTLNTCIREGKAAGSIENPSIAVIPISNSMCDPELEYISAGMHDAIINELGNINSLLVKSKTATQSYLDSKLPGQQIGNELGANVIVKHSVVCTDEGIRLLIQLIQLIQEEKEIWSDTYDLDLGNSLTMYRDIAKQIAKSVKADVTTQEQKYLNTNRPVNAELYKKYLQGVFYMNKLTKEDFEQGLKFMNEAIAIDPKDPLPYLGLALGYSNTGHASDAGPDAARLSREYALKALALDSTLAEAYTVLATQYLYDDWDFPATEKALRQSIALNPNDPMALYVLGSAYSEKGRYDQAIETHKKGIAIDQSYLCGLGVAYARAGKKKEALDIASEMVKANSGWYTWGLADIYAILGDKERVIQWVEAAYDHHIQFFPWLGTYRSYKAFHDDPQFREIVNRIQLPA